MNSLNQENAGEFCNVNAELIEQGTQIVSGLISNAKAKKAAKKKATQINELKQTIQKQEAIKKQLAQKVSAKKVTTKSNTSKNTVIIVAAVGGAVLAVSIGLYFALKN